MAAMSTANIQIWWAASVQQQGRRFIRHLLIAGKHCVVVLAHKHAWAFVAAAKQSLLDGIHCGLSR
jgi:hypothetical protein